MPDSTMIAAAGLGLRYASGTDAVAQLNLSLRRHEFVSILGPSGCGKSTLLRLVAGLLRPTAGTLRVGGGAPGDGGAGREAAFVFQAPTLLPWRRVAANVRLPLQLGRAPPPAGPRAQVAALLELVGLSAFAEALPHQLSGGMQMRVSLARALVTRPALLLLDEPFGALDELTRQRLNEDLLGLWQRDRWSALFVTHNVFEAVFLSERVCVMGPRPGRVVAEFAIPFPYPRRSALRAEPAFAALAGRISEALREAVA